MAAAAGALRQWSTGRPHSSVWAGGKDVNPGRGEPGALGAGAGVTLVEQSLEAAEEGQEAGLISDPVGDAERAQGGREAATPACGGRSRRRNRAAGAPGWRVERERRRGARLEECGRPGRWRAPPAAPASLSRRISTAGPGCIRARAPPWGGVGDLGERGPARRPRAFAGQDQALELELMVGDPPARRAGVRGGGDPPGGAQRPLPVLAAAGRGAGRGARPRAAAALEIPDRCGRQARLQTLAQGRQGAVADRGAAEPEPEQASAEADGETAGARPVEVMSCSRPAGSTRRFSGGDRRG